jgi:hypothetical protein
MKYYIQTRTLHGWHRLFNENYPSLEEASKGIERHLDSMFFEHGEMLPSSIFRIVKCKPKKQEVLVFEEIKPKPGYVLTPFFLEGF